jgi:hypothetical protein
MSARAALRSSATGLICDRFHGRFVALAMQSPCLREVTERTSSDGAFNELRKSFIINGYFVQAVVSNVL